MRDVSWQDRAACAGESVDRFFPDRSDQFGIAAALAVCDSCEVTTECLLDAVSTGERFGVRGGVVLNKMPPAKLRDLIPVRPRGVPPVKGGRACHWCGSGIRASRLNSRYCSEDCTRDAQNHRARERRAARRGAA